VDEKLDAEIKGIDKILEGIKDEILFILRFQIEIDAGNHNNAEKPAFFQIRDSAIYLIDLNEVLGCFLRLCHTPLF
jgi:hypothetical protein